MAGRQPVSSQTLERAIQIAKDAHAGQKDKNGEPFIAHVERVAAGMKGRKANAIAYLHDVVEKGEDWTLEHLRQTGFSESVISAVDSLTKRADEAEEDFVRRAISDPLARPIKRADLEDNLRQARQAGLDTARYERGLQILRKIDGK